jgi:hypothetical protein
MNKRNNGLMKGRHNEINAFPLDVILYTHTTPIIIKRPDLFPIKAKFFIRIAIQQ